MGERDREILLKRRLNWGELFELQIRSKQFKPSFRQVLANLNGVSHIDEIENLERGSLKRAAEIHGISYEAALRIWNKEKRRKRK